MKNVVVNLKRALKIAASILLGFTILSVGGMKFSAQELVIGKCKMTITTANTGNNYAHADGPCSGLVEGFYSKEQNRFNTTRLITNQVKYDGQKFKVYLPKGDYLEAELTVYIKNSHSPSQNSTNNERSFKLINPLSLIVSLILLGIGGVIYLSYRKREVN